MGSQPEEAADGEEQEGLVDDKPIRGHADQYARHEAEFVSALRQGILDLVGWIPGPHRAGKPKREAARPPCVRPGTLRVTRPYNS
jgi:hypothetical protein